MGNQPINFTNIGENKLDIYQYIDDNPSQHTVALRSSLNLLKDRLNFYLGVDVPTKIKNFLSICNGVYLDGFKIHSGGDILKFTLDNIFINSIGEEKKLEVGRSDDGFVVYNYSSTSFEYTLDNGEILLEFDDMFSVFEHFSDLFHDGFIEEKSYEDLILDSLSRI